MYLRRLGDMREDHDLTQQEVADYLGCKREVYRRYEKGYRDIPLWALKKLAEKYQVSCDYLLEMTNVRWPVEKIVVEVTTRISPLPEVIGKELLRD